MTPTSGAASAGRHLAAISIPRVDGPTWWAVEPQRLAEIHLDGTLLRHDLHARALEGNALGDPATRPLIVHTPAGAPRALPLVLVLHGSGADVGSWFVDDAALDRSVHAVERAVGAGARPAIVAYVDAWTSLGGSQYLDTHAIGAYQSYLVDDVIPFLVQRYRPAGGLAIIGHSSGGYGALRLALDRPGTVTRLAALAPDALFEGVHLATHMPAVRRLHDAYHGSYGILWEHRSRRGPAATSDGDRDAPALDQYLLAAAYSWPHLLFDTTTGELDLEVWAAWLRHDPLRMIREPRHQKALSVLEQVHLVGGRRDHYYADAAVRALANALRERSVPVTVHIPDADHADIAHLEQPYSMLLARLLKHSSAKWRTS
jgi:S-formylglutathione hydrolase FrmB